METLNWKDFFRHHPIFFSLPEIGVKQLLEDKASEEHRYSQGTVIFKEGDNSKSVYLIGTGSVSIGSKELDPYQNASFLTKGDFFGESILIDQRPRTASVVANEDCVLLEIRGHKFVSFLNEYPDIQSKVLLKLGERLRNMNDRFLSVDVHGVDERLKHFNTKLDTEIKAIDSSLRSAQVVFDQTKLRTDEIIRSAERRQSTFTTIGYILTFGFTVLGIFGYTNFREVISNIKGTADTTLKNAEAVVGEATAMIQTAKNELEKIDSIQSDLGDLTLGLSQKEYLILKDNLYLAMEIGEFGRAGEAYKKIEEINIEVIKGIEGKKEVFLSEVLSITMTAFPLNETFPRKFKEKGDDLAGFLDVILKYTQSHNVRATAYSLQLASIAIGEKGSIDGKEYSEIFSEFEIYFKENREEIGNDTLSDIITAIGGNPKYRDIIELLKRA